MNVDAAMRDLATRAAARATIEQVASVLAPARIPIVALKGAALALDAYPEDVPRPLTDVDVLVLPEHVARATRALVRAGFTIPFAPPHAWSRTLVRPGTPLTVDLHALLFSRGLFAMRTADVFARARPLLGVDAEVSRPHGLDLVAHAIGHFAKTRPPPDVEVLARDLAHAAARDGLGPDALARHLVACGLARAARYALSRVPTEQARAICAALPRDALAQPLVALARGLEDAPLETPRSVLSRHVLNATLPRGAVSLGYQVIDALGRRARAAISPSP